MAMSLSGEVDEVLSYAMDILHLKTIVDICSYF